MQGSYNLVVLPILLAIVFQSVSTGGLRDGLLALNRGDLSAALSSLEAVSREDPQNPLAWAALAQVYLKNNQREAALNAARKADQFGPDNPTIQHALAMFYSGEGEPDKAALFESRFAKSPMADKEAFLRAANLYLASGNPRSAIDTARAGITQTDSAALHHVSGQAYMAMKQPGEAITELQAAARMAPSEEEFSFDLAQALLRSERFAEAAANLERSVKAFPQSPQMRLTLGVAYYGLRRFPEAIKMFLETIDMAPEVEQPYIFLGRILDQAADSLPVIQTRFESFRRRHPENYWGSFLVAKALAAGGAASDRIEPLLRESIAKNGALWETHSELSDVLARKHDYAAAAAELEQSAKLNASEPSIAFRLARLYDRLHEPEKAAAQRELHQRLLAKPKAGMGTEKP